MLGAIAGDIIGSPYERHNLRSTDFPLFRGRSRYTDDTVLTVATAEALMTDGDYAAAYRRWFRRYPDAGYGGSFLQWGGSENAGPYGSFGNGSAMRVSPVGWAYETTAEVLRGASASASVTHNHPEGVRGAQAVALAIFLSRSGRDKQQIRDELQRTFQYNLERTVDAIRPSYTFDVTCQGSVPEAIIAFLDSHDFEDAIRKAVSLGGDSDTIACIAGSIAEAFYCGVPEPIAEETLERLPPIMRRVVTAFIERYQIS